MLVWAEKSNIQWLQKVDRMRRKAKKKNIIFITIVDKLPGYVRSMSIKNQ
jgi:hypothetical protein